MRTSTSLGVKLPEKIEGLFGESVNESFGSDGELVQPLAGELHCGYETDCLKQQEGGGKHTCDVLQWSNGWMKPGSSSQAQDIIICSDFGDSLAPDQCCATLADKVISNHDANYFAIPETQERSNEPPPTKRHRITDFSGPVVEIPDNTGERKGHFTLNDAPEPVPCQNEAARNKFTSKRVNEGDASSKIKSHLGCLQVSQMDQEVVGQQRAGILYHDPEELIECGHQPGTYSSTADLQEESTCRKRKKRKYVCSVKSCSKKYSTAEGLRLHVRNHHKVDKQWKCMAPDCDRSFVRQSDLRMHILRIHSVTRPFPCDQCHKGFACHSELRRHMMLCHSTKLAKPKTHSPKPSDCPLLKGLLTKALIHKNNMKRIALAKELQGYLDSV